MPLTIFIWAWLWGDQWRRCMVCFQSEYGSQLKDTNYQAVAMGQLMTLMFLRMPLFQKHLAGKSWRSQQLKLIAGVLVNGQIHIQTKNLNFQGSVCLLDCDMVGQSNQSCDLWPLKILTTQRTACDRDRCIHSEQYLWALFWFKSWLHNTFHPTL